MKTHTNDEKRVKACLEACEGIDTNDLQDAANSSVLWRMRLMASYFLKKSKCGVEYELSPTEQKLSFIIRNREQP